MKRPPGRPPRDQEAATSSIRIRVTPAQRIEIRRVADENGASVSGVIREAVNEYVGDYQESRRRPFRRHKT